MTEPQERAAGVTLTPPDPSTAPEMQAPPPPGRAPSAPDSRARPDATRQRIEALAFDAALAELQDVVGRLEAGNLPLEESIELYEQGVLLHERCARLLGEAELRLQRLVDGPGGRLRTLDLSLGEAEED